jgi:uncharacterized damage-inducible protein DinB
MDELAQFMKVWEQETQKTLSLLRALPNDQYDFRPDAGGRSLGELAWHLAEGDAYMTHGIEQGKFDLGGSRPAGIERPKEVAALAPAFERVHRDAVERVRKLKPEDLDRKITFFSLGPVSIRDILWNMVVLHTIHHRGQLVLMCRLAGGRPPGMFGPNREETAAARAQVSGAAR